MIRPEEREEPIHLVAHRAEWSASFAAQRHTLERILAPWISGGIHHVGSTAVPGLDAKPTVDIMAGVRSLDESRAAIPALEEHGWLYAPYRPQVMHWFCRPSVSRREHHLHLVPKTSASFHDRLRFRDMLLADTQLRTEYARLKHDLGTRFTNDREAYTDAKSAFIAAALGRPHPSMADRSLPVV